MKRLVGLLAAALLLVPVPAAQAAAIPGEYPEPVRRSLATTIEEGAVTEEAEDRYLDRAREELEAGNLSMAMENYILHRVVHEREEIVEEVGDRGATRGQEIVDRRLETIVDRGRASADQARSFLDELSLANLTQQGLDTAIWGSVLVARGQMGLNVHAAEVNPNVYDGGTLNVDKLAQRLGAALGGTLTILIGLEIASQAPAVGGDELDPEEAHDRLSRAANQTVPARGSPPDYVPEGSAEDSALVRLGLLHVAAVELKLPEYQQRFGSGQGASLLDKMATALRFDREQLGPYAEAGFPFARAGFEQVAIRSPSQLEDSARSPLQRAHAFAFVTSQIHKSVFPNATEEAEDGTPAPGVLGALAALGAAAVAARRRFP